TEIRAELMNIAYGQEARHRASAAEDKQLKAALGEFDHAAALLEQRRGLDHVASQRAAGGAGRR
ncbi:MAG TPA: hypothetical protein VN999_15610, partial [Thermoanaerobaculia bacterium]|nr:hypothetical protein [Thermoanaerobaculia bacterium]